MRYVNIRPFGADRLPSMKQRRLLIIVGVVAVLLFGKRLPEVGRSFGRGIAEFKKGLHEVKDELDKEPPPPEPPQHRLRPPAEPPASKLPNGDAARTADMREAPRVSEAPSVEEPPGNER